MTLLPWGETTIALPPALADAPVLHCHPPAGEALDLAAEAARLADEALSSDRVLVVVPDRTRAFPVGDVLPLVLARLLARGVARIQVAIASGTHVASAADVLRLGDLPEGVRLLRHDPDGRAVPAGVTPRGTDVRVAPALLTADRVLVLGGIAFHYFAGFGGGGKMLFPGLGARAAVAANHRRSLAPEWGLADGVEPGRTTGNPVWEDLRDAHALLPQAWHLTLWAEGAGWSGGRWNAYAEFDGLCARFARAGLVGERHGAEVVIASAGGWPRDLDVVQAHKALHHAALFARDGAELILFAACGEGVGSPALARWLARPDRATLERAARAAYDLNAQTAISLAQIAARVRVTWIAPHALPGLAPWGIAVETDPSPALARAAAAHAAGRRVVVLPVAGEVLPASL